MRLAAGSVPGRLFFLVFLVASAAPLSARSAQDYFEAGRNAFVEERWYDAMESFLESLRVNPSYAEPVAYLAECFYALGEFDQALSYVRRARSLSRSSAALANLEAFILVALGDLPGADAIIRETLAREPYNREALFAAAELDVARGKSGDAAARYRDAARRYPDDRRALLSLALVLGSLGDAEGARAYAERAITAHPDDHRVRWYAAYLDAAAGRLAEAARSLSFALKLRPSYAPARSLLAQVRYRSGEWEEAARLADQSIAADRNDSSAWYLKGLSYARLGRAAEAHSVLSTALSVNPQDEFARAALEELLISSTPLESAERAKWASYHLDRAADYRSRDLADQALFEYRRALRIDPYSKSGRANYADLLRSLGYPARQLAELRFLQELGKADRAVNDAVETYDSLLADAPHRRWGIDPNSLETRNWKIAVFSVAAQSAVKHADAGRVAALYVRDLLAHDGGIASMDVPVEQPSFSAAFRAAREAGADYFLVLSAAESERDLSLSGRLYVARTGSAAAVFEAFRTGADRLRNASRKTVELLSAALPFRARLISRKAGVALIDKGRSGGVEPGMKLEIVKQGRVLTKAEGVGASYSAEDVTGALTIEEADEEIASGTLARKGFFDRIAEGDEVFLLPEAEKSAPAQKAKAAPPSASPAPYSDPELRYLLRTLR